MAGSPVRFRAVLDSNVLIAAQRSARPDSPNRELVDRWQADEYTLLYSLDTLHEYAEKLAELPTNRADAVAFIATLLTCECSQTRKLLTMSLHRHLG